MSRSTAYTSVPPGSSHGEPIYLDDFPLDGISHGDHDTSYLNTRAGRVEGHNTSIPLPPVDNQNGRSRRSSTLTALSHSSSFEKKERDLVREFKFTKQLIRLLAFGFIRFLLSGALIGGFYAALWTYSSKPVMSNWQKRVFNTIVTALSMALGLNIASSFRNVATDARWWFLSRKQRPLKEIDMILSCNSLTTLSHLAMSSIRRPTITLICLLWVLINIAGQAGVAMLGLTYSFVPSCDPSSAVSIEVNVTDMSRFYFGNEENYVPADQLAAHTLGQTSLNQNISIIDVDQPNGSPIDPFVLVSDQFISIFKAPNYTQHVFLDWPADPKITTGAFYSNRVITGNSTCNVYKVVEGGDGSMQQITYLRDGTMQVANFQLIEPKSTTYYTSPDLGNCGPRCANVCAFENTGRKGFYYECEIYISNVTNATLPSLQVPDHIAKLAAGAIALQGYQASKRESQYQRYPAGFQNGLWQNGSGSGMAEMMRTFAVGALAAADLNNPYVNTTLVDLAPNQAVTLVLDHPNGIHAILITICGAHFVLFVLGALVANRAVVIDDSYLAIARLLRPVVESLGNEGGLLRGDEICEALGDNVRVVYGTRMKETARGVVRHLEVGPMPPTRKFPSGFYD